jgi:hypothetical protein
MTALCTYALESDRKLIFSTTSHLAEAAAQRSYSFGIDRFKARGLRGADERAGWERSQSNWIATRFSASRPN